MSIRKRLSEQEWEIIKNYRENHTGLAAECDAVGIPVESVKHYWYKGKNYSINAVGGSEVDYSQAFAELLKEYTPPMVALPQQSESCQKGCKVTITDAHVGLDPNPDGSSLFQYEYNEKVFNDNLQKVYQSILKEYRLHGKFDVLILDDLGDGVDGWNGETTRGGHKLEQNMGNVDQFKVFVKGKVHLIEQCALAGVANKIIVRNVANCNHGGEFGEITNTAIKMLLERGCAAEMTEFNILRRFMEHFKYGDHTFILTHGKDKKHMKHGLPLKLDDKTKNFINSYIDHYEIKSKYIHLEKGDLHQIGYQRTKKFDYRNYMSFAPPSGWVQGNFEDTYSGYSVQVVPKYSNEISHTDYFFELKKAA